MFLESIIPMRPFINWMLNIVIEKPMQLTIVSAVPFFSPIAFLATSVEKRGESAITTIPKKIRKPMNKLLNSVVNIRGDMRQHTHERSNAMNAVRLAPVICAR